MTVLQPVRLEGHSVAVLQHWKGILAGAIVHRGKKLSSEGLLRRNQDFPQAVFFSSRGQVRVRSVKLLAILHPPSYHPLPQDMSVTLVAFPLVVPKQQVGQSWADLARADTLKAHDGHSLEMSSKRSRIEDDVPVSRVEGQDTTPEPVSVEHGFAGGKPETVEENLAGGELEPSAEDFRDGLAEQDTAGGLEHLVKIDQLQPFIARLSMAERLRVLGLPEVHAVRPPVKTPSIRSAVELSEENSGSCAPPRGNFCSAAGGRSFNAASRKFSNLGPVEFHASLVMTRKEQVARETQQGEIPPAAAQGKTETASARFTQAISHADVTNFAQLSSDAQPRPTSKTLVTRSSRPVPNAMHYAPFPGNDDQDACPNFSHAMFSRLVISVQKFPGSQTKSPSAGSG